MNRTETPEHVTYILSATHIAILAAFKMEETFTLAAKKKKKTS